MTEKKKPTIAELEAVLSDDSPPPIRIRPDGGIEANDQIEITDQPGLIDAVAEAAPTEIWTPPETLSPNVGRMAWTLFVKWWENFIAEDDDDEIDAKKVIETGVTAYRNCIELAKRLEEVNKNPGGQ